MHTALFLFIFLIIISSYFLDILYLYCASNACILIKEREKDMLTWERTYTHHVQFRQSMTLKGAEGIYLAFSSITSSAFTLRHWNEHNLDV